MIRNKMDVLSLGGRKKNEFLFAVVCRMEFHFLNNILHLFF